MEKYEARLQNGAVLLMVVVRADRGGILNKGVKVMDAAKAAGAGRPCPATEKDF